MKTFFRQKKGERIQYSGPELKKKKLDSSGRRNMKTGKNLGLYRWMKSSASDKYRNRYKINCFSFLTVLHNHWLSQVEKKTM